MREKSREGRPRWKKRGERNGRELSGKKAAARRERFCQEYAIDRNGTRAAIAAGFKAKTASQVASRFLHDPEVQTIVERLNQKMAEKLEITRERVLAEIAKCAFANMQDFTVLDERGMPILNLSKLTRDQFAAVQEIREDATGGAGDAERRLVLRTTVKLINKTQNLELLGKHLGLFPTKVDLEAKDANGKPLAIGLISLSESDLNARLIRLLNKQNVSAA